MIDTVVDQAWTSLLARALKRRGKLRAEMGDEIDLFLPQSRLLTLAESKPALAKLVYLSAQSGARRNAFSILRKLGMPPDYFWKFEFWPKARAFTTLEKIVNKVFSLMMSEAKEGNLKITDLNIDPLRISIDFADCVECAGIKGLQYGICYYHAGALSGIISGLINRDLDGFETGCRARGDKSCYFILGDRSDEQIKTGCDTFVSPREISADLASRLKDCLEKLPARAVLGNLVDVNYLQLVMASTLLADPKVQASTNFEIGSELGRKLAPSLGTFLGRGGLENIGDYYNRLGEFCFEVRQTQPQLQLAIKECAESVGDIKATEMMSFLFGELQGLASELTKTEMVLKESRFEGDELLLTLAPKA